MGDMVLILPRALEEIFESFNEVPLGIDEFSPCSPSGFSPLQVSHCSELSPVSSLAQSGFFTHFFSSFAHSGVNIAEHLKGSHFAWPRDLMFSLGSSSLYMSKQELLMEEFCYTACRSHF